jgi:hypothetical protein
MVMNNLLPMIHGGISKAVRSALKEVYSPCPYWLDDQIYEDLYTLDKEDKGDRAHRYFNQCHTLEVSFVTNFDVVLLKCRHNNYKLGPSLKGNCMYDGTLALPPDIKHKIFPEGKLIIKDEE